jgi:exopolysaccharide biosynthesis polyprenyl glycosylphosphotransferase
MAPSSTPPEAAVAVPLHVRLPTADVRSWLDERAFRGWTESSRRFGRIAALFMTDSVAGLLSIGTVLRTWELVSADGLRPLPDYVPLVALVFCLLPLALWATGAYAGGKRRLDLVKITCGVLIAAFLGWVQARLFGRETPDLPNKTAYLYSAAVIVAYVWLFRLALDRLVASLYDQGLLRRKVLVVSTAEEAERLATRCRTTIGCELEVLGRVAPHGEEPIDSMGVVPTVGHIDDIGSAFSAVGAQGLIIATSLPFASFERVVGKCFRLGATVSVLPVVLKQLSGTQIEVRESAIGSFLQLRPIRLDVPHLAVKRLMDLVLTTLGLAACWPLFCLIAVAIKLDSRGAVLFGQVRAGVGGKPFRMMKFRTMMEGADAMKAQLEHLNASGDPRLFKIKDDPRITRVGRFLRRTSLDELPQLVNVLRGEMSLVGPRPFFPGDLSSYETHHFERLHVLPGITGLWQVSGRSDVIDFEEVIRLDRKYIENWSILADVSILLRTFSAALNRGAY